jgi:hypothetical protein
MPFRARAGHVRPSLPCGFFETHDKDFLCCAFYWRCTVNIFFGVCFFFCGAPYFNMHGEGSICCESEIKRTAKMLTHDKDLLDGATVKDT